MLKNTLLCFAILLLAPSCGDSQKSANLTEVEEVEQFRGLIGQSLTMTNDDGTVYKAPPTNNNERCAYQKSEEIKTVIATYKTNLDIHVQIKNSVLDKSTSSTGCGESYTTDYIMYQDINQARSETISYNNFTIFINKLCAPTRPCRTSEQSRNGKVWYTASGSQLADNGQDILTFNYAYLPNNQDPWLSSYEGIQVLLVHEATLETVTSYNSQVTTRQRFAVKNQFETLKNTLAGKTFQSVAYKNTYTFELTDGLIKYDSYEQSITTPDNVVCNIKSIKYLKSAFKIESDPHNYVASYDTSELDKERTPANNILACEKYLKESTNYDAHSVFKYEYLGGGRLKIIGITRSGIYEEVL